MFSNLQNYHDKMFWNQAAKKVSEEFDLYLDQGFFEENVRNPVWICREPISLILGARFSLILGTRW